MHFFQTNQISLHYKFEALEADKPVLVFSNSLGTDFRIWDDVAKNLSNEFGILRYDKRGHGLSSLGATPYRLEDHISDLSALLDHLRVSGIVLCGLSVGGMIAQGLCTLRPDLVKGLLLCDTGLKIGTLGLWQDRIETIEKDGLASMVDAVMERWFTSKFRREDNPVFVGCRTMFERQDDRGYSATCAAIRDADLTEQSKLLSVPTLCIVGDQDAATPPSLVQELSNHIVNSEFQIVMDSGHLPCVEQPEKVAELIRNFVEKNQLMGNH